MLAIKTFKFKISLFVWISSALFWKCIWTLTKQAESNIIMYMHGSIRKKSYQTLLSLQNSFILQNSTLITFGPTEYSVEYFVIWIFCLYKEYWIECRHNWHSFWILCPTIASWMQLTQYNTDDDLGATEKRSKRLFIVAIYDVNKLVVHSQDNSCTI